MIPNASVATTGNVQVGPIGTGWTAKLDAVPHSPLQSNGSTGEIDFTIPAYDRAHLLMNNPATFNYTETQDADSARNSLVGGTTYAAQDPTFNSSIPGVIDSVSISGGTASCTMGTPFTQFATNDIEIPWVASGTSAAAFDLALQLAGNQFCTLTNPNGYYWSLFGHDIGFDYKNKVIYAEDRSYYTVDPFNSSQVVRLWDMRHAYSSSAWYASSLLGLCSTTGEGSSPSVAPGTRTSTAFRWDPTSHGTDIHFNYGANNGGYDPAQNGYSQQYGFGPWDGNHGKTMAWSITRSTKMGNAYITYWSNAGGTWTQQSISTNFDCSALDFTKTMKCVTDISFPSSTSFALNVWVQAADGTGPVVAYSSGTLANTKADVYAKPWDHVGGMAGLYQVVSPSSFDPSTLLANYENTPAVNSDAVGNQKGLSIQGVYPAWEPIAPYVGSLWDYICQVFTAKQTDLRLGANGQFILTDMTIQDTQIVPWAPQVAPTFAIDNSNTADTVEVDAQLMSLNYQPIIYDARTDGNQVYSIAAGQTTTFTITGNFTGSAVYNPCPFYDYASFNASDRFGAFIVSGADDLPILATQWVAGGGRVYVKQTGPSSLEVTVVCPNIVTANADGGTTAGTSPNYYFGISDGQNQHGCFLIVGGAGSPIVQKNFIYQTGASYTAGNSSPGAIQNPAASSMRMVNTLAGWASSIATGPNLTLTATLTTQDLAQFGIGYVVSDNLGQLPGKRLLYRNNAWRIMEATLHSGGVDITAAAMTTYGSSQWNGNWGSQTVDQYAAYWANCNYDDLNTMPLAGPVNNWDASGALAPTSTALGIAQDVRE